MICARVAGVPRPFSRIASRSSSSSICLPAPSIAESSVASLKRGGGRVTSFTTSTFSVATFSPGLDGDERRLVLLRHLAVDREPAGLDQHLAFGLERLAGDARDAGRDQILGRGKEHGEEAPHDHVVELLLGLVQVLGRGERRDDREVVRHLGVVEDALVGAHPLLLDHAPRERAVGVGFAQHLHRRLHGAQVVLRQGARIGAGIGQHLVLLVERLGERERRARREAEATVGLALQAGQVVEQRRDLRRGLRLLGDLARLAVARRGDRLGAGLVEQPLGTGVGVVVLLLPLARRTSDPCTRPPWRGTCRAPPSSPAARTRGSSPRARR